MKDVSQKSTLVLLNCGLKFEGSLLESAQEGRSYLKNGKLDINRGIRGVSQLRGGLHKIGASYVVIRGGGRLKECLLGCKTSDVC